MLFKTTSPHLECIQNPLLKQYAGALNDTEEDLRQQASQFGLAFDQTERAGAFDAAVAELQKKGVVLSNDCKSLHTGWISPSCVQCRKGLDTLTLGISVQCPKRCYFCFNPNQANYERLQKETEDIKAKLYEHYARGDSLSDIALTGGEPFVHKQEVYDFFNYANTLYPQAYTRIYTSGAFLDEEALKQLEKAELNEIRFSIKMDESASAQKQLLELIGASGRFIENVVVEMPVMPDGLAAMKELLTALDEKGIAGINLLEFCFPFNNASEFARRGYLLKKDFYRVIYDYWYSGGLPIAGSEKVCLELLAFALDENLDMGVHYCSLENKFSGQIYQQNNPHKASFPCHTLSGKDYFLKSAKVFGSDIQPVQAFFQDAGLDTYRLNKKDSYLEFPVVLLKQLATALPDVEIGISYNVVEQDAGKLFLRELRVDATTPASIDIEADI